MSDQITNNKILLNNAERIGIRDPAVIKKADEFLRILNTKTAAKGVNEIGKIVLCLDLAASHLGLGFDKETAFRLGGLKKTQYQNNLNNFSKFLNLDKPLTISELCVQLSCTVVKEVAEDIFKRYKDHDDKIKDISHPQYAVVSVFTACKIKNIKVDRNKFVALSRLKNNQWKELVEEFDKFVKSLQLYSKNNKKQFNEKENDTNVANLEVKTVKKKEDNEIEEYEVWRERILRDAYTEIAKRTQCVVVLNDKSLV